MVAKLFKWILVGVLAGLWVLLYNYASAENHEAILIVFSILGAAHFCKCKDHGAKEQAGGLNNG